MIHQQNQNANPEINLKTMTSEDISKLRNDCDKELKRRFKVEQRKAKADIQKKADKYKLEVTVEAKK